MTNDPASLLERLANFDGKSTTHLSQIAHEFHEQPRYVETLLAAMADERDEIQSGTTWLLKHALVKGHIAPDVVASELVRRVEVLTSWSAQLHICQCIAMIDFAPGEARSLGNWVQGFLAHDRPFLRAWSLDALVALAHRDPELEAAALAAVERAQTDPAASVRARARNLRLP
ncbi:MAG: hypothetical protein OXR62_15335 [Ahrensia sp.]|nr:hypothetical protein [Ahrensia sp.]